MKAAIRTKYGLPELLKIQEVDLPTPNDNEVLVKVYATTVSRTDNHLLEGTPFIMRLFSGLFKPRLPITGTDFAGQIESTGKNVSAFKTGDNVMGFGFMGLQSHAQYITIPEDKAIITMPGNISYEEAAACIEGAFYAHNLVENIKPVARQNALVYGATGAIGSSTLQFLHLKGVSVTAVCNGEHSELVKSLGADRIIDYKKEDFTKDREQYDFILDSIGRSTFAKCKPLLKKKGIYSSAGGMNLLLVLITPLLGGKKVVFAPPKNLKGFLSFIKDLLEKGKFKPVIDRKYPLDKIVEAFSYVASGQKIGNVIITMDL